MAESRKIRNFRCADSLWRSLEDEATERGLSVDALITEALWSYLRSAPEYGSLYRLQDAQRDLPFAYELSIGEEEIRSFDASMVVRPARAKDRDDTEIDFPIIVDKKGRVHTMEPKNGSKVKSPATTGENELLGGLSKRRPRLTVHFSGKAYEVQGDRFLIGRTSSGTDLQIRDANVSRKHAAIIFHDGAWYLHDLQSTNGVTFQEKRVHMRRIEPQDRFNICGYELILDLEDGCSP